MTQFSVIIPSYNREKFIEKTIRSVLNIKGDYEVIVIDDGSTDKTEAVVKSIDDSRVRYIYQENAERGAARNRGAREAKGRYVNFLDSDDYFHSNHLSEAQKIIDFRVDPEVFALGYRIADKDNKDLTVPKVETGLINGILPDGNILSCNGVFIRRDIALQVPFSEVRELSGSEDWQLWLRLAARFDFHFENIVTSTIVNHDGRSVLNFDEAGLIKRTTALVDTLKMDTDFMEKFSSELSKIRGRTLSYISLHLSLERRILNSWTYLIRSIAVSPSEVLNRRFLAICKHNFLGLIKSS